MMNKMTFSRSSRVVPGVQVLQLAVREKRKAHLRPAENGLPACLRDIQDRKETEEKLMAASIQIDEILDRITDGFFALDNEWRFIYVNKAAKRRLPVDRAIGKCIWDIYPVASAIGTYVRTAKENNTVSHFEMYSHTMQAWVEIHMYPSAEGISVYFCDITDRKLAEKKERESHELLKEQIRLLELDPDYSMIRDMNDVIVFWNHRCEEGYGWTRQEAVGSVAHTLLKTVFPKPLEAIKEELLQTGRWEGELEHTRADGATIHVRSCWLVKNGVNGAPEAIIEADRDITEEKRIRKEMERLDQLNLVGQMAAGVSHEVRNPMTTVRGFIQMFMSKKGFQEYREIFQLMIDELDRANGIISEFLSMARAKQSKLELADLNAIVAQLEPLIQADAMKEGKNFVCKLQDVPLMMMDSKEVRQLILNLTRNGIEVTPPGQAVTVKTYVDDGVVVLAVADEGPGIDKTIIEKIGTPFFTTKENGTGLGLTICYGIAAHHRATVDFATGPEGTTFYIRFTARNHG